MFRKWLTQYVIALEKEASLTELSGFNNWKVLKIRGENDKYEMVARVKFS